MPADFTPLTNEISGLTDVVDSTVAFMDGFEGRLNDAIAADNLSDNSNVGQLAAAFSAQKTKLVDAIVRNTPAQPPDGGGDTGGGEPGTSSRSAG